MPNCSVIGCGNKRCRNQANITLHRLPKSNEQKKVWLETIGVGNLNKSPKSINICSFHFQESCFNRTLNKITLHDGDVPSRFLLSQAIPIVPNLSEKNQIQTPFLPECVGHHMSQAIPIVPNLSEKNQIPTPCSPERVGHHMSQAIPIVPNLSQKNQIPTPFLPERVGHHMIESVPAHQNHPRVVPEKKIKDLDLNTSTMAELPAHALKIIQELKDKCLKQSKKIKRLHEKVERQGEKIKHFRKIIKHVKDKHLLNSVSDAILDKYAGPQDFK